MLVPKFIMRVVMVAAMLLPAIIPSAFVYGWGREICLSLNLNSVENFTPFRLIWSLVGAVPVPGGATIIMVSIFFRVERHKQDN